MSIPIVAWRLIIMTCYEVGHSPLTLDQGLFSLGCGMVNGVMGSVADGADGVPPPLLRIKAPRTPRDHSVMALAPL